MCLLWMPTINLCLPNIRTAPLSALLHVARMTRPDILYAISVLSKHLSNPQMKHWNGAKRVLAYLHDTVDDNLVLGALSSADEAPGTLKAYADTTWADDPHNRRSRSGGVMFFNGSMISAWSKQQATVALSSTDAESRPCHSRNYLLPTTLVGNDFRSI